MKNHVPEQKEGAESDAMSTIDFDSEDQAIEHFKTVTKRFLDINSWELIAGKEKAEFSLRKANGELSLDKPEVGDYVRIKLPLLHNVNDDGYDWVKVEVLEHEKKEGLEQFYLRLRPSANPKDASTQTEHFLAPTATSNFFITRTGKSIKAEVMARNETPNSEGKDILEKVRNKIVALGGMIVGSKIQWEGLTNGLIHHEK